MIRITFYKNKNDEIYGFKARSHGDSIVCAAVSALTLNTVNAIEAFCDCVMECDYNEDGGYLYMCVPEVKSGKRHNDAGLLLNALHLGISSIIEQYPDKIEVTFKE